MVGRVDFKIYPPWPKSEVEVNIKLLGAFSFKLFPRFFKYNWRGQYKDFSPKQQGDFFSVLSISFPFPLNKFWDMENLPFTDKKSPLAKLFLVKTLPPPF
jgi:hypothetical protein